MNPRIPTVEEIYNEYHRETFYAAKSFYPKSIKNFDKVLTKDKLELLTKFQNFIKRNPSMVDWKLYITACAQYFKRNFSLSVLGSLNGNKIYRTYINYNKMSLEKSIDDIEKDIVSSLKFITEYSKDNNMTVPEYFKNRDDIIPIALKHIYSGSTSTYFYACLDSSTVFRMFSDIPDDVFFELFNCSRNDFLQYSVSEKHDKILCKKKLFEMINKISKKFDQII